MGRPSWDRYFLGIAEAVAERSDCTRAKVGAVIVDVERRIMGTGYVGTLPGRPGCLAGACPRGQMTDEEAPPYSSYDNCISLHAEVNALMHSGRAERVGGTIYVTREPCTWCYKLITASGLLWVVFSDNSGSIRMANLR